MRNDKPTQDLPAPLARVLDRLECWRKTRETRRIPERLWSDATELAARYGVHCTSQALGLNYYSLKGRLEASADPMERSPVFVDVVAADGDTAGVGAVEKGVEGVAEWVAANGAMFRIEWRGASSPDLASLTAAFFGGTS